MGMLGRKLAAPQSGLVESLNRSYADEWFAHYNYFFVAHAVTGPSSASIQDLLTGKSEDGLQRADKLLQRIVQLGGEPVRKLTDLPDVATNKPFKLPADLSDVDALLRAVLDAERTSIRTLQQLYEMTRGADPVTEALVVSLLGRSVAGEERLERLLGDEAPEMTGR